MGYYASIEVSVCIPAKNIDNVRKELIRLSDAGKTSFDSFNGDSELDEWFKEHLLDCEIYFEDPSPLEQLALASTDSHTRGDLVIVGGTHQKWRSYLEDMLDVIAPFVTPDSEVHITGEEGEQVIYQFKEGERTENWGRVIFDDERIPMIKAEAAISSLRKLIENATFDSISIESLRLVLDVL